MMEDVALEFPAKTEGHGGDLLEPTEVPADGTKEFDLTARSSSGRSSPGKFVEAMDLQRRRARPRRSTSRSATRSRIVLQNDLPESTDIHFHGIRVPEHHGRRRPVHPAGDPARARASSTSSTALEPAVGIYHSHHDAQEQIPNGLFGAFTDRRDADPGVPAGQGLHEGRQEGEHGAQRRRHHRPQPERQELPRHRAVHACRSARSWRSTTSTRA